MCIVRCGDLIDHLKASLPSPLDLPDAHGEAAGRGAAAAFRSSCQRASVFERHKG
jgi:hypothetical protein